MMMDPAGVNPGGVSGSHRNSDAHDNHDGGGRMMRLANQTSTANPHVGGVGGPMVTQVTQTRRTIYPSIQGDMMRTVGHDLQYQQPGEILQMHAYLRCSTEALFSEKFARTEEIQQLKTQIEVQERQINRLNFDLQHERNYTTSLQDKVEIYEAEIYDGEKRLKYLDEFVKKIELLQAQLTHDQSCTEVKLSTFESNFSQECNDIHDRARKAEKSSDFLKYALVRYFDDLTVAMTGTASSVETLVESKLKKIDKICEKLQCCTEKVKNAVKSKRQISQARVNLEKQYLVLKEEHEKNSREFNRLRTQRDLLLHQRESLEEDKRHDKIRIDALKRESKAFFDEKSELSNQCDRLKQENGKLEEEKAAFKSEASLSQHRLERSLECEEKTKTEMEELQIVLKRTRDVVEQKEIHLTTKDASISEKSMEISRLLKELTVHKSEADTINATLRQKEAYYDEVIAKQQLDFEQKLQQAKSESELTLTSIQNEHGKEVQSIKEIHSAELEKLTKEKNTFEQKVEAYKEMNQEVKNEYAEKERTANDRYFEAEKCKNDAIRKLQLKEEEIRDLQKRQNESTDLAVEERDIAIQEAVKRTELRKEEEFSQILAKNEERYAAFEKAGLEEVQSLKRQHEKELHDIKTSYDDKIKNAISAGNLKETEAKLEQQYRDMAKRSAVEKEKQLAQEKAEMEKTHDLQLMDLNAKLAFAEKEIARYKTQEMLDNNDDVKPPIIHTSDKIEEVTRHARTAAASAMKLSSEVDLQDRKNQKRHIQGGNPKVKSQMEDKNGGLNISKKQKSDENAYARSYAKHNRGRRTALATLSIKHSPSKNKISKSPEILRSKRTSRKTVKTTDPFNFFD